ncbi:MAG: hypothetical protein HQL41_02805, partial [Alphaproteobacteria bacterium]|nr:hypothetical protein [Alphaproteobacteria bacterium]
VCEAGAGLDPARLVCDAALHLTSPAAQDACPACGKPYCRACAPEACPACGHRPAAEGIAALATDERATP